jgi:ATP-binding cassette subfamily B multidrug efflux pump
LVLVTLRRFFSLGGMERWIDPLEPAPIVQPPGKLVPFYRHFLAPMKGLIAVTLVVSLIASVVELSMFAFLGSLVDRMAASGPERFVAENFWLLACMGFVLLVLRPISTILSRGLVNLALAPNLSTLVRWQSYRYVLRQSLGFFQNDFSGPHQPESHADWDGCARKRREHCRRGLVPRCLCRRDVAIMVGFDWRLLLPLVAWTAAYAVVVVTLVRRSAIAPQPCRRPIPG